VGLGDLLDDGEAEPRAVRGGGGSGLEDLLALSRGDARAVVLDVEAEPAALEAIDDPHADGHPLLVSADSIGARRTPIARRGSPGDAVGPRSTARRAVLHAVGDQVLEDGRQSPGIGLDRRALDDLRGGRPGRDRLPAPLGQHAERDRLCPADGLAPARERERVLDERLHPVERVGDRPHVVCVGPRLELIDPGPGDVQRVPQVVRDDPREPLEPLGLAFALALGPLPVGHVPGVDDEPVDGAVGVGVDAGRGEPDPLAVRRPEPHIDPLVEAAVLLDRGPHPRGDRLAVLGVDVLKDVLADELLRRVALDRLRTR